MIARLPRYILVQVPFADHGRVIGIPATWPMAVHRHWIQLYIMLMPQDAATEEGGPCRGTGLQLMAW